MKRWLPLLLLFTCQTTAAQTPRVTLGSYTFPTTGDLDPNVWAGRGDGTLLYGAGVNNPGSGYAPGDTGMILGGGTDPKFGWAFYRVLDLDDSGGVSDVQAGNGSDYANGTYATANGFPVAPSCSNLPYPDQPGGGSGLTLDISGVWSPRTAVQAMAVTVPDLVTDSWIGGSNPGAYWVGASPPVTNGCS